MPSGSPRHSPGDRWYVDETYVNVNGVWRYVYRAVDQHGQVIDVLLTVRRDAVAAHRFFPRGSHFALKSITTAHKQAFVRFAQLDYLT